MDEAHQRDRGETEFERRARTSAPGAIAEVLEYLLANKKWWLAPMLIVLLIAGALMTLAATSAGPFVYTLF